MKIITVVVLFALCFVVINADLTWDQWKLKYNRAYASDVEEHDRRRIFEMNRRFVNDQNQKDLTYTVGLNSFADLTSDEFSSLISSGRSQFALSNKVKARHAVSAPSPLPTSFDWGASINLPPVADETEASPVPVVVNVVEAAMAIVFSNHTYTELSDQNLLDCVKLYEVIERDLDYVKSNGIDSEKYYPTSGNGPDKCKFNANYVAGKISSYDVIQGNETEMAYFMMMNSPLITGVNASSSAFQFYQSGVFQEKNCGTEIDTAMMTVGWGLANDTDSTPFWRLQNVWGVDWGENGYMQILRGSNMCGIATWSAYVVPLTSN